MAPGPADDLKSAVRGLASSTPVTQIAKGMNAVGGAVESRIPGISRRVSDAVSWAASKAASMPKDMAGVMREFKSGELHSGSSTGPVVKNRKQAIAIGLSEQRKLKGRAYGKGRSASKGR